MDIEVIREFLGWCTVINVGLLAFSAIMVTVLQNTAVKIHHKMFGLDEATLRKAYFSYLAYYKLVIIAFNLVPYLALRIIE